MILMCHVVGLQLLQVSMISARVLEILDLCGRTCRGQDGPFGRLQVLFCLLSDGKPHDLDSEVEIFTNCHLWKRAEPLNPRRTS